MAHQIAAGPSTSGSSKISAPLMTSPRATETKKRSARLEDGLKIIRGEDVQRQQRERHGIRPGDARRHGEDRRRRPHEDADIEVRQGEAQRRPENGERRARHQRRRTVRPLILADHRHVHNAVNTRDERAAERRQKVFAVARTHIVPEQIHGHPPRKRKKPDKEQTFQSAPYPAAVSLNSSPSSERGCYARRKMDCQAGKWLTRCPAVCTRCP